MFAYIYCGIKVESDVELPGLAFCDNEDAPGICIRSDNNLSLWKKERKGNSIIEFKPSLLEACLGDFISLRVSNGSEILYDMGSGSETAARLIIVNTGLAAIMHQRRHPVIHGASSIVNGKTIIVSGNKGAGKSTFNVGVINCGGEIISDDTTPVFTSPRPHVKTASRAVKLWSTSYDMLSKPDIFQSHDIIPEFDKTYIDVSDGSTSTSELSGIIILSPGDCRALERIDGKDAFVLVYSNLFMSIGMKRGGVEGDMFDEVKRVIEMCDIYVFRRPKEGNPEADVEWLVKRI